MDGALGTYNEIKNFLQDDDTKEKKKTPRSSHL